MSSSPMSPRKNRERQVETGTGTSAGQTPITSTVDEEMPRVSGADLFW